VLPGILISWWLLAGLVFADLTEGIQAIVPAATGAPIEGVKLTIKILSTPSERQSGLSATSECAAPQLRIGTHEITIEKAGFRVFAQNNVLRCSEKTRVDSPMQIGNSTPTLVGLQGRLLTPKVRLLLGSKICFDVDGQDPGGSNV
jgi:hypothetical protein